MLEASAIQLAIYWCHVRSSKYGSSENEIHGNVFKCHVCSFIYFQFRKRAKIHCMRAKRSRIQVYALVK